MTFPWKEKRVLITGGHGFLGSFVVEGLRAKGAEALFLPHAKEFDLRDKAAVQKVFELARPEIVFHLAATVGGIQANQKRPADFFYDNAMMGLLLLEAAKDFRVHKFVMMGSVCSYPKEAPTPFREESLWQGFPEETNATYGIAKRSLITAAQAYHSQYQLNAVTLLATNLYGPRDHFEADRSHVIPALIRRFVEAKAEGVEEITLWGDGSPTREFLYVTDAASAVVCAAERYSDPAPLNVGNGREVSISEAARTIAELVGYSGKVRWDTSRPNGQLRRSLDLTHMREKLGFEPKVSLKEGLKKTLAWYRAQTGL